MVKSHPAVIAIGQHKGHKVAKFNPGTKRAAAPKQSTRKGRICKRVKLVRQIIAEVGGVSSYEKRAIEFLKAGSMKDSKRALRISKKALGTHRRAKLKRDSLMNLLRAQQAQRDRERDAAKKK